MKNETRKALAQYFAEVARLNGVASANEAFNVEPTIQQRIETKLQESSNFLGRINIIGVDELQGEKLGLGISGTIARRTPTATKARQPRAFGDLTPTRYKCEETDFDTYIPWAKLDAWAKFPDFKARLQALALERQKLDRIQIGFTGVSAAVETDPIAYPLLEDVNIGWLQSIRNHAPDRVMDEGATAGKIVVGPNGDYKTMAALTQDALQLLDPWFRKQSDLVAISGRDLIHGRAFKIVNQDHVPTEQLAADILLGQQKLGTLPSAEVPAMPENAVLITTLSNLSIYYQNGARRRYVKDVPERKRVEFYESSNDAYVVEDFGLCALVENIELEA